MNSSLTRRGLLGGAAAAGLGIAITGDPRAIAGTRASVGYGDLVADPAGVLSLPPGFSYKIVAQSGITDISDGVKTPSDPDGTGIFASSTGSTLVNNHEIGSARPTKAEPDGVPTLSGLTYDTGARGGTTTIDVDADGNRLGEYTSVAGTCDNCAGGKTPWDTWLTCEESEQLPNPRFTQPHGYVFEVDPTSQIANVGKSNVPLRFLGRFAHEAVAVDPVSRVVYETEDANEPHGLFYRWVPPEGFEGGKGALRQLALGEGGDTAGSLQAMSCSRGSKHIQDLSQATLPGIRYKVEWVDVPERSGIPTPVRMQFTPDQVTGSRKLEGAWWADGGAYFVSSFARSSAPDLSINEHDGQIWFYDPASETVTLQTLFGVNLDPDVDTDTYDGPDNITVSPYGGLVLAEDGKGIQHVIGVTDQGKAYPIARNELNDSEFCGPGFSADGRTLFVNIQSPGHVFAITGPWRRPSDAAT